MRISLIVAMSENQVIGNRGQLPWHLSADLKQFKKLTMGHHIIMGRKTFESIGRLLPGRMSIMITRQSRYSAQGALVANDLDQALQLATGDSEIFVIGGAEIYRQAIDWVDRLYLTRVHATIDGDTFFTDFEPDAWRLVADVRHKSDDKNDFDYSFEVYDRVAETTSNSTNPSRH